MTAYSELAGHFGRIAALSNAVGILQWDSDVMMPKGAAETRAESMALLHVLRHGMVTEPRIGDWLARAEDDATRGAWEKANLREIRRIWTVETALPAALVEASSKAVSACEMRWRQARADSDFAGLLPFLSEVLNLQRKIGQAKGEKLGLPAYDALLNDYEPGGRSAKIDALFDGIDFILLSVSLNPPGKLVSVDRFYFLGEPNINILGNFVGIPAITLSCGLSSQGLPIGLQILGRRGTEATSI